MSSRLSIAAVAAALLTLAGSARADCDPASGISTCFDADNLWLTAGPGRFQSISPAVGAAESKLAFAAATTYLDRPILLNVPSPDPMGRDIPVVSSALNLDLSWVYSPRAGFELTLATPIGLHQSGSGAEGVTSQSAPPLARTTVHDLRLGAGMSLPIPKSMERAAGLAAKARLELSLPTGDEDAYASAGSPVAAPSLSLGVHRGALFAGAEVGARLRRSVPFASANVGSALLTSLGVGADLLSERWLALGLEALMLQSLAAQPEDDRTRDRVLVAAEWLGWVGSSLGDPALALSLGGGTGIPLASEVRDGTMEHFAGVTTPRFRFTLALRYSPR
jgi:hypothetical protein